MLTACIRLTGSSQTHMQTSKAPETPYFQGISGAFLYQSRKGLRPSMSITVFLFPVPVQLTFRLIFCIIRRNKARWAKVFAHSIAQLVKRHWGSEMLSLAAQIHEYKGG